MSNVIDIHHYTLVNAMKGVAKGVLVYLVAPYFFVCTLLATFFAPRIDIALLNGFGFVFILFFTLRVRASNKRIYEQLRNAIILEDRFNPQMELRNHSYSAYLGLDTQNGTIVYFRNVNTKERLISNDTIVVGFTNYNWRKCELHGKRLLIYTNDPATPYVDIIHSRAPALYERLCAMRNLDFSYDVNFPGWIDFQAKQVAEELNLNLITVKS